jgi:branched-chain amino acid aminotransferase
MEDKDGLIWMDGEWIAWREAKVHVLTHTLHYGCGVFEGLRAYRTSAGTAIFRLRDHTDRLFRSAHIMKMAIPFDKETLNRAQCEAVSMNGLSSAYIRPMCFLGSEGMGLHAAHLKVHVMIAAWEWGSYLGQENMTRGIKVRTSSFTRSHVNSAMLKAKANGNYLNSILAVREAVEVGCDEALLLDHEGFVAEGSGENIFLVRNDRLFTPDLTSALEGITRETIMTIAREAGIEVVEKRITRDEVYIADEAFFTGTAAEVTPIREVDGRTIGAAEGRGPLTEKLQSAYFEYVHGKRQDHRDWLQSLT